MNYLFLILITKILCNLWRSKRIDYLLHFNETSMDVGISAQLIERLLIEMLENKKPDNRLEK